MSNAPTTDDADQLHTRRAILHRRPGDKTGAENTWNAALGRVGFVPSRADKTADILLSISFRDHNWDLGRRQDLARNARHLVVVAQCGSTESRSLKPSRSEVSYLLAQFSPGNPDAEEPDLDAIFLQAVMGLRVGSTVNEFFQRIRSLIEEDALPFDVATSITEPELELVPLAPNPASAELATASASADDATASASAETAPESVLVAKLSAYFAEHVPGHPKIAQLVGPSDSGKWATASSLMAISQRPNAVLDGADPTHWLVTTKADLANVPMSTITDLEAGTLLIVRRADDVDPAHLQIVLGSGMDCLLLTQHANPPVLPSHAGLQQFMAEGLTGTQLAGLLSASGFSTSAGSSKTVRELMRCSRGSPLLLRYFAAISEAGGPLPDEIRDSVDDLDPGDDAIVIANHLEQYLQPDIPRLLARCTLLTEGEDLDYDTVRALVGDQVDVEPLKDSPPIMAANGAKLEVNRELISGDVLRLLSLHEDPVELDAARFRLMELRGRRRGTAGRPRAQLARDYWTIDDLLGYRPYAQAVATFIRHPDTKPPLTIGVKGPWGSGKTSMMRMLQAELDPVDDRKERRKLELVDDSPNDEPAKKRRPAKKRAAKSSQTTEDGSASAGDDATVGVSVGEVLHESLHPTGDTFDARPTSSEEQREKDWRPTVWFNPWMYQSGDQVLSGLAYEIIQQITERLSPVDRERFWLKLNVARVDREVIRRKIYRALFARLAPALIFLGLLAISAAALLFVPAIQAWAATALSGTAIATIGTCVGQTIRFMRESASQNFGKLVREPLVDRESLDQAMPDPAYKSKIGLLQLVHTDMRRVLDLVATEHRPVVVFVDDLDRCTPGPVSQVIEAVNLFLAGEFPNCVFVIAMEPEVVAAHVEVTYKDLVERMSDSRIGKEALGWRFLEKIVQLPLTLPPLDEKKHVKTYVKRLLGTPLDEAENCDHTTVSPDAIEKPEDETAEAERPVGDGATTSPPAESPDTTEFDTPRVQQIPQSSSPYDQLGSGGFSSSIQQSPSASDVPQSGAQLHPLSVEDVETAVRERNPSVETLPAVIRAVRQDLGRDPGLGELEPVFIQAYERVFLDLYSDMSLHEAIESALCHLDASNPRELKRYINVFRFYMFIAQRQRLEGAPDVDGKQIAKLAALVIRFPDLLGPLMRRDSQGNAGLRHLENLAGTVKKWNASLDQSGIKPNRQADLRALLDTTTPIADIAERLL